MTDYGKPRMTADEQKKIMGQAYWNRWNSEIQKKIDNGIEANRKADGVFSLGLPAGTDVKVEQTQSEFIFGAHIFNFNQLGTAERNRRYKELYGTLFNSATIAFYWKQFEAEEGHPRFESEYRDSEEYWNSVTEPKLEAHWRRPATDDVVKFCEEKGIRRHGHTLTWGNNTWQTPVWFLKKYLPEFYEKQIEYESKGGGSAKSWGNIFKDFTPKQIEKIVPGFVKKRNSQMMERIAEIALRYRDRLQSWDVCNESASDFKNGAMIPGDGVCKSWYGLMPGDYTYRSFKTADAFFPKNVKLNINDYNMEQCFPDQVNDLLGRGCKIDIMGAQMHLFDPKACTDIASGVSDVQDPQNVMETMARISKPGLPIHLSEITITSPTTDLQGQAIQSMIAYNLYRLWFSLAPMMGITWWNVVDDCGAPGEPSVSGLFSRDMEPKLAYYTLNDLINREWKTNLCVKAEKDGSVAFRGFRGSYRLSWEENGKTVSRELLLK